MKTLQAIVFWDFERGQLSRFAEWHSAEQQVGNLRYAHINLFAFANERGLTHH
jgi:hypothetical protein